MALFVAQFLVLFVAQLEALFLVLFAHNKCIDCIDWQRQLEEVLINEFNKKSRIFIVKI